MKPKALSTLSQKSATVAENGETTATVAEFGVTAEVETPYASRGEGYGRGVPSQYRVSGES